MNKKNTIYLFSYGTIQDELFYKNLLSENVVRRPAILNGYAKCIDDSEYFLLKKDIAHQVEGTLFEITEEELFMIDRWEMFPQYQRFQANIIATDTNEIIEDVYVYTRLEYGKYYLAPKEMQFSKSPNENEQNLRAFIALEKESADFPLLDNAILFEVSDEELEKLNVLTHPYLALILDDQINKNYLVEPYSIFALKIKNKNYALLISFGRKNNLNSIFYFQAFEGKINGVEVQRTLKPLYEFNLDFLADRKPLKYISLRRDLNENQPKFGEYENKAYEIVLKDFDIDPFKRLDLIIRTLEENIE
ncbi:gamma-glutamylcyclotransferase family protein [Metamycoplasma auris]|uniref:Gamma-glutamyl AIG2-like cyclotransferase n=1 Tax=Metamycoplasma auris TaxID=51363 RepID=A0A2W7I203_9BACT|nr:gamma-glutamylcyclotransferase family protein [Metamycoplasma auris]PZW01466.1 gamma-glutamyl AIG2-like cyclotransferase [Metamycoplasma auris]